MGFVWTLGFDYEMSVINIHFSRSSLEVASEAVSLKVYTTTKCDFYMRHLSDSVALLRSGFRFFLEIVKTLERISSFSCQGI